MEAGEKWGVQGTSALHQCLAPVAESRWRMGVDKDGGRQRGGSSGGRQRCI